MQCIQRRAAGLQMHLGFAAAMARQLPAPLDWLGSAAAAMTSSRQQCTAAVSRASLTWLTVTLPVSAVSPVGSCRLELANCSCKEG